MIPELVVELFFMVSFAAAVIGKVPNTCLLEDLIGTLSTYADQCVDILKSKRGVSFVIIIECFSFR